MKSGLTIVVTAITQVQLACLFMAISTWLSMMFMYMAGMQRPRIAITGTEFRVVRPVEEMDHRIGLDGGQRRDRKAEQEHELDRLARRLLELAVALLEPADEVREPRGRDRDGEEHQRLEEPRWNRVPADDSSSVVSSESITKSIQR